MCNTVLQFIMCDITIYVQYYNFVMCNIKKSFNYYYSCAKQYYNFF